MYNTLKRLVYQVLDLSAARQWYDGILKTEPVYDSPLGVIYRIGDCTLSLTPGGPDMTADNGRISAYWEVDDVDAAVQKLIDSGASLHTEAKNIFSIRTARVTDPFGNTIGLSGKATDAVKRTVDKQASETAMGVALCRALTAAEDREEIRGPDHLAHLFLTEEMRKSLEDGVARGSTIERLVTRALYGYFIARTAFFDRANGNALGEGIPQIVFLGAGYDTRPYRLRHTGAEPRIFEIDALPTQQRKREILTRANVAIPPGLSYVTVDFSVDSIEEKLRQAGYDQDLRTLFIWEGVMYYLTPEAVDKTLDFVKRHSPEGSTLCFDYLTESLESVSAGEPFRFWIESARIGPFLAERGITVTEHYDSKRAEASFLTLRDGTLAEKSLTRFGFILARTTG
jgi:methyltransferase (TIGR00027 family)